MSFFKDPAVFLDMTVEKIGVSGCSVTDDYLDALYAAIKESIYAIDEELLERSEGFIELWEELIENGLTTFTIFVIITAKMEDRSELDAGLFARARELFRDIWPCPRVLAREVAENE